MKIFALRPPHHRYTRLLGVLVIAWLAMTGAVSALAQQPGVLTVGASVEPPTLDPQRDAGGPASEVEESIFETLVAFDNDMKLVPKLAESWVISEDGKTYTFRLRPGVVFHDGTPLNAEAVKFTFERALGALDGKKSRYATLLTQLDSVEAVDNLVVAFHLKNTFAPFLNNLAHLGNAILSPAAVTTAGDDFGRQPIGTGPFQFEQWQTGQDITLKRNEAYWQEGLPKLERVDFRYIPDASTRLVALESGEIDLDLGVPEADFNGLSGESGIKTYKADTLRTVYLWLNPTMAPFDDIAVRHAIAEAVDREGIAAAILEGLHRPATRPTFAPGVFGVSDEITPYVYDPEHAKQVLDDAGWRLGPNGVRVKDGQPLAFTLYVTQNRYPKDTEIGAYLQGALAQTLNANVDLGSFEWETYRNKIFAKELGVFLFGAGVSTADLDYVMTIIFHTSSRYNQIGSTANDEIIEAQQITDEQARLDLYRKIQQEIADEYLWVPLYWQSALHASRDYVNGFQPHPTEAIQLTNVSVEGE